MKKKNFLSKHWQEIGFIFSLIFLGSSLIFSSMLQEEVRIIILPSEEITNDNAISVLSNCIIACIENTNMNQENKKECLSGCKGLERHIK